MKVYACPVDVIAPTLDAGRTPEGRYDFKRYEAACQAFREALSTKLTELGYTGPHTGQVFRAPMGDGYAQYMVADGGRSMALIHLPLGDAWQLPEAHLRGLRKADVVAQLTREAAVKKLFAAA